MRARNRDKKKVNNAILKIINWNIVVRLEKKKNQVIIYNTLKYKLLEANNTEIDTYNTKH